MTNPLTRIGVVGAGTMGAGIAEVCARAGTEVVAVESDPDRAEQGRARIEKSLGRGVERDKITRAEADQALARLTVTAEFEALADRELVIEAASEDEAVKAEIFARLDRVVSAPDAILATNTSSIPIIRMAMATGRPEHVIGLHFFNPAPVMSLVELVPSLRTDTDTLERVRAFAEEQLGKAAVQAGDRAGFVVNALLIPYLLSAIRMLESGFASAEDIDAGMVRGCAHPMGPLALSDLIGLDTVQSVAESLYAEFREAHYAPPPLLSRMVDAGRLGRKTGQGFFAHGE